MGKLIHYEGTEIYAFEYKGIKLALDVEKLEIYQLDTDEYKKLLNCQSSHKTNIALNQTEEEKEKSKAIITKVRNIAIEVSNDCNLRCSYCYGEGGGYGKQAKMMTKETAKKCIDFLIENGDHKYPLGIIFFGGEPLMNFEVMEYVVTYCNQKKDELGVEFTYGMTTNATLLTPQILNFIEKNHVIITISIDGSQKHHDTNRVYANGKGSYHIVERKIEDLLKKYASRVRARATISNSNLDILEVENHLQKMGFEDIVLSFVDVDPNSKMYIKKSDFEEIFRGIEQLGDQCIRQILEHKVMPINMFKKMLATLYTRIPNDKVCGAGTTYLAFTADGEIYPCHRFSNNKKYLLGNVNTNYKENRDFEKYSCVENRPICSECFARHFCGGNCLHTSAVNNNQIRIPHTQYCSIYKKVIEISIYIYYKVKSEDPNVFINLFQK